MTFRCRRHSECESEVKHAGYSETLVTPAGKREMTLAKVTVFGVRSRSSGVKVNGKRVEFTFDGKTQVKH